MKICYCGPISLKLLSDLVEFGDSLPRGYEYPLGAYLLRNLLSAGIEVAVVTSCKDAPEKRVFTGDHLEIHIAPRRTGFPLMMDSYKKERQQMVEALKATRANLVHAQWTYEFAHAGLDSGLPCLVTARDAPWEIARQTRSPYRVFRAAYSSRLMRRIQHMSVISPYLDEQFRSMGFSNDIHIIPNGLPEALFAPEAHVPSPPVEMNQPAAPQSMRFLSVTGWNRCKNPTTLIKAFNRLRTRYPEARLTVAGKDMGPGGLAESWAERKNIATGITFAGMLNHPAVIKLMRHEADIFVHSTREESFCMTILEAMAQHLPVVAMPGSGAVPWLLAHGKAGLLAASPHWADLADAMEAMALNPKERTRLGSAGYHRAKAHFTMDAIANKYISLYQHILDRNPRS